MKVVILGALCAANVAAAQAARPLGPSQREHPVEFSSVDAIRELGDGRVIVVDRRERTIHLADFTRGTAERIGREGSGPNEIALPAALLPLPGDTTAIWDGRNARMFYIGPAGSPIRTDRLAADNGSAMTIDVRAPRFADAAGRLYFAGVPAAGASRDSIPLLQFDRRTGRIDTVGSVLAPKSETATVGPPGQQMTLSIANPFSAQQDWVVTADGRVAVVRSPEYRVDWTHPARRAGAAVQFTPLPVTEADKEDWRQNRRAGMLVRDANSRGGGPSAMMIPEPTSWPSHKPAFLGGSRSVQVDFLNRIWVLRAGVSPDAAAEYDVFDGDRLGMRIRLPKGYRIVGFGKESLYTTRPDENDLLRLNRHALPR